VEDHKEVPPIQILIEVEVKIEVKVEVEVIEIHLMVDMEVRMVDIINMKVSLMEVDEDIFKEKEVLKVMVEVIEVNNQTMTQIAIIVRNLSTWQKIVIKGNMMHGMESYYNKGIMHQLTIKVMNNYL
jgi:hypothetical protein